MLPNKKYLVWLFFLMGVLGIGCSSDKLMKEDIRLLDEGNRMFAKASYLSAEESYQKLVDNFPDSPYRVNALLGLADTFFMQEKYMEAGWNYRDFYELYPVHPQAARAHFYRGMGSFEEMRPADRDQTSTLKALQEFEVLTKDPNFSDNLFYDLALEKIAHCHKNLSDQIFYIGSFYFRTGAHESAITRMKGLMEKYPGRLNEDEVFYIVAESYFREDSYKKALEYFENLLERYPGSAFATDAKERIGVIKNVGNRLSLVKEGKQIHQN